MRDWMLLAVVVGGAVLAPLIDPISRLLSFMFSSFLSLLVVGAVFGLTRGFRRKLEAERAENTRLRSENSLLRMERAGV